MRLEDVYVGMKCITDYGTSIDPSYSIKNHGGLNGHIVVVNHIYDSDVECNCLTCGAKEYTHLPVYLRPFQYNDDCEIVGELGDILT